MQAPLWRPPIDLSAAEHIVVEQIRVSKLFIFLRGYRHQLLSESFQQELCQSYEETSEELLSIPPAQVALALLLQSFTGISDDAVIEAITMDRRWQLVLDCLGSQVPPFSKGALLACREQLRKLSLDRRLLEQTTNLAIQPDNFNSSFVHL